MGTEIRGWELVSRQAAQVAQMRCIACKNLMLFFHSAVMSRELPPCPWCLHGAESLPNTAKPPDPHPAIDPIKAVIDDATNIRRRTKRRKRRGQVAINGKSQSLRAWCRELGMSYETVRARIKRGWSMKEALMTPVTCDPFGAHASREQPSQAQAKEMEARPPAEG